MRSVIACVVYRAGARLREDSCSRAPQSRRAVSLPAAPPRVLTADSVADAQFDVDAVKALHKDPMIGTCDAAAGGLAGELLDEGEAALLIIGESALQTYVDTALTKA